MQSLLSFCSICLQLSNLGVQKSELLLKRDEACTLCLTELLQPSNNNIIYANDRSYREILNDGLYFNNPLLQEALKLKLEQQLLVERDVSQEAKKEAAKVEEEDTLDPFSRMLTQEQIEELFENLVQTVQKLSSSERGLKEELIKQKNLAYQAINKKVQLLHVIYKKASLDLPNKPSLPARLKNRESDLEEVKIKVQGLVQKQFEGKLSGLSSASLETSKIFSEKIQELRNMMARVQDAQNSKKLIQEISDLQTQASNSLENFKSSHQVNLKHAMRHLDERFIDVLTLFEDYAKPIKNGLKAGERVATNGHLTSENGVFNLVMQKDWNLVLYKYSTPIWSTKTYTGYYHETQPELFFDKNSGILKITERNSTYAKTQVNQAHKNYTGDAQLRINNNGTIDIIGSNNQELWRPRELNPVSDTLNVGNPLLMSDVLVSKNGVYSLILREDCDLVLYKRSMPIWTSGTISSATKGQCEVRLTQLGSLVIKNWNQNFIVVPDHSFYQGKTSLLVTDDGALVIKGGDQELWNSRKENEGIREALY